MTRGAVAVVLGSAFDRGLSVGASLRPRSFSTPFGSFTLHQVERPGREAFVCFRHGLPHSLLPNQIPYRAMAWALRDAGCGAVLLTSSVGVLDAEVPLYRPLLLTDLLMPENRLPDGSTCTLFEQPTKGQGHLVLTEGIFSRELTAQVEGIASEMGLELGGRVTFAYAGGPRSKTAAENRLWTLLGAQVNSMTLGPEAVLLNEAEISVTGLVVGHKYSLASEHRPADSTSMAESLERSRAEFERLIVAFLERAHPVSFRNQLFRFGDGT